jgi:hypothetical protein
MVSAAAVATLPTKEGSTEGISGDSPEHRSSSRDAPVSKDIDVSPRSPVCLLDTHTLLVIIPEPGAHGAQDKECKHDQKPPDIGKYDQDDPDQGP